MSVKFIKGDITECEVDIIINAANTELKHGGGVAKAIARKAGEQLIKESEQAKYVPIGEFYVTSAGNLKAKKVIHIPTIDYTKNTIINYTELEKVFDKAIQWTIQNAYKSIATPLLGTGVVGLDKNKVSNILQSVAEKYKDVELLIVDK